MRRRHIRLVALGGVIAVLVLAALVANPIRVGQEEPPAREVSDVKLVTVDPDSEARLWPFTSRARRFETLTLPINVVVRGDPHRVRSLLKTGDDAAWNETADEWQGLGNESVASDDQWYGADGATRYTYVYSPGTPGDGWQTEFYQLHRGDYFGTRSHIRAYMGGRGEHTWTAMQAHDEHWDWFRLRHTVGSTSLGRRTVESAFYGEPAVRAIHRQRFANGGMSDADGWSTVVVLRDPPTPNTGETTHTAALLAVLLAGGLSRAGTRSAVRERLVAVRDRATVVRDGLGTARKRVDREDLRLAGLAALTASVFPAVRWGAIAVERAVPGISPKLIAGSGYLLIAFGLPACAVLAGRLGTPLRAGLVTVGGVALGIVLDYTSIGVAVVPLDVFVHRGAVLAVLGAMVAASHRDGPGRYRRVAAVSALWLGTLAWPLLGLF